MQDETGFSAVLGAGLVVLAAALWATVGVLAPRASALAAWLLQERLSSGEILGCLLMAIAILVLMRTEAAGQRRGDAAGNAMTKG